MTVVVGAFTGDAAPDSYLAWGLLVEVTDVSSGVPLSVPKAIGGNAPDPTTGLPPAARDVGAPAPGSARPRLDVCFQPAPCSPACDAETQFCYFGSCDDRVGLGEGCGYLAADPDSSCFEGWCSVCSGVCEALPHDCGCSLAPA